MVSKRKHYKNIEEPLPNGDVGIKLYEKDCTKCKYFRTDGFQYPGGTCRKWLIKTGLDYTCEKFIAY